MSPSTFVLTTIAGTAVIVAAIWRLMVRASRRRDAEHARRVIAARDAVRAAQGRPRDGRPLDDYEKRLFASVLIGFMTSPDDESSERKN